MASTIDKLFKGYSLKEIEEILLKSAIKEINKKNQISAFSVSKNERMMRSSLKM